MSTSETVQAAQRLLAERERFGLAKYGTTVDRTDLQASDWLQHAIEEASDLLLYLLRLQQMMPRTPDSDRSTLSSLAGIAPDLMPLEDQPVPAPAPADAERRFGPITSDPADAERNLQAKEDAERAAYLARWKDAPEWADFLSQDLDGRCDFWEFKPTLLDDAEWSMRGEEQNRRDRRAADNFLGSVRCEPRPVQGVEG